MYETMGWTLADWDNYWTSTEPSREIVNAQRRWVKRIVKFARKMNTRFDTIADVGCGPAIALFELARKFPETSFYGFDSSGAIVKKNSNRARSLALSNISFRRTLLPKISTKGRFSFILCIATLHYLRESLLAISNLYSILKPGGFLVFNYPNLYTRSWYRRNADLGMKLRFAVLLAGQNILSKKVIEANLGLRCHNFWKEVEDTPTIGNPCVFVKKPSA